MDDLEIIDPADLPPTACLDWAKRLKQRKIPITTNRLPLRTKPAERLSRTLAQLRVADMAGQPYFGDLQGTEYIDTVARALFGGDEIREALLLVPKKSSKTSGSALVFLAAFLSLPIPNQAYNILSPTISISNFTFDQIRGAIDADPELQALVHVRRHTKEIENLRTGATLTIKTSSLDAVTGLKGFVLVDELHVLGTKREARKLRQQLKGALAVNRGTRGLYITTQSDDEPAGIFRIMLDYARGVRDGKIIDPSFLPILYEPWKGLDPWRDTRYWPSLMPAYPHIIDEAFLRGVISEAESGGPAMIAEAKSQYFNVEIGRGQGGQGWDVAQAFKRSADETVTLGTILEEASRIAVGIDVGGSADLASIAVVGDVGDRWMIWTRSWLTEKGLRRNVKNVSRFEGFRDAGELRIIDPGEDVSEIVGICERIEEAGKLVGIGVDPADAADVADALEDAGFEMEEDIVGVGQTSFRLAPAVRTMERRAEQGRLVFADQGLTAWALANVIVGQKGNAPSISKDQALDRIDPVMAILDAVTVLITKREEVFDVEAMCG